MSAGGRTRGARHPVLRGLLALALLTSGLVAVAAPATPPSSLTDDERRRMAAGEVIVHDVMPPGASEAARGGTAFALVRATPEQVWRILVDYPGHYRYYPRVEAAEVVVSDERHAIVRYQVGIGPFSFSFYMDKYPDPGRRRIEWRLADGYSQGLFRENSGYWLVEDADRYSLVTYAIAVKTRLPTILTGGAERDSLVSTITALRSLAEEENSKTSPRRP
jgi:ribosome-associated toxin RatA of RatAB toxin-antitoxin module